MPRNFVSPWSRHWRGGTSFCTVAPLRLQFLPSYRFGGSAQWWRCCGASPRYRGLACSAVSRPCGSRFWLSAQSCRTRPSLLRAISISAAPICGSPCSRGSCSREPSSIAESEATGSEQSQRSLLEAEIAALAPPTKGATNVYAIGIAGWADQDVFLKELDGGLAAMGDVLPIKGHTLRLANHSETARKHAARKPAQFCRRSA